MRYFDHQEEYTNHTLAITDTGDQVTYGDLELFHQKLSDCMGQRGLVFMLCENSIGSVMGYLGFLRSNMVPLLLDRFIDIEMLCKLQKIYKPDFLYVPNEWFEKHNIDSGTIILSAHGYQLIEINKKERTPLFQDLALLLTTSGSTGSPKLVRQSYDNICSNAIAIVSYLSLSKKERPITTLPMSYTYGLSIINSHVLKGATILLTNHTLFDKEFWEFFKKEEATSFGGVPYTYEMLKRLKFLQMDLPSLKTMTQAGGKLAPSLHKEFSQYALNQGKKFIVMYGQTEATARMSYLPSEYSYIKCGSMGIVIPLGKFYLMDENNTEIVDIDVVGELVYEGPNVTLGYATQRADLTLGDERKGVLFTGDMAKKDADGFYYITGRKKRFLKIFGNRVNLDEIEQILKAEYKEIDFACTGVDDSLTIYIACQDKTICEDIIPYISGVTRLNPKGFTLISVPKIPKNEAGKTLYNKL